MHDFPNGVYSGGEELEWCWGEGTLKLQGKLLSTRVVFCFFKKPCSVQCKVHQLEGRDPNSILGQGDISKMLLRRTKWGSKAQPANWIASPGHLLVCQNGW